MENSIILNGQEITKEELEKLKEDLKRDKTRKLLEIGKNKYKIRLLD